MSAAASPLHVLTDSYRYVWLQNGTVPRTKANQHQTSYDATTVCLAAFGFECHALVLALALEELLAPLASLALPCSLRCNVALPLPALAEGGVGQGQLSWSPALVVVWVRATPEPVVVGPLPLCALAGGLFPLLFAGRRGLAAEPGPGPWDV